MVLKSEIICITLLLFFLTGKGQDPVYSQFYANQLLLNPAFAGADECPRTKLIYRNQWPGIGKSYITYNAWMDVFFEKMNTGLGLIIVDDIQGNNRINNFSVSIIYAYHITFRNDFTLAMGFSPRFTHNSIRWDAVYPDMLDAINGPVNSTGENFIPGETRNQDIDFSAGFTGFYKEHYFGAAMHHITKPIQMNSSTRNYLPLKITLHYGTNIIIDNYKIKRGDMSLSPNIIYQYQKNFQQLCPGVYYNYKSLISGVWMRINPFENLDSFILLLGINQKKMKLSYSFDITMSKIRKGITGSHEITCGIQFDCWKKKKRKKTIKCPPF